MAKQIIVLAFIIFFAAMRKTAAQEHNVPSGAAGLAPAAAAAGIDVNNASALIGALNGKAKDGAPIGGPISAESFKNLGPPPPAQTNTNAATIKSTASAGAIAAAGVVGSLLFL